MHEMEKPAGVSGGQQEFFVSNWKPYVKNTLRGFLSINLPSGLVLHNCSYHLKDGQRWIGLPSRQYKANDGSAHYSPFVDFVSKEARENFQAAAVAAVRRFLEVQV